MADEPVATSAPEQASVAIPAETSESNGINGTNGNPSDAPEDTPMADAGDSADTGAAANTAAADTAPASASKSKKKGPVPDHKGKKLNKKKSMPKLSLDCKPGEFYWARLKGYPPWPAVICDEEMLPESLLATRPVSTARPDGSIRDDFKEGGKNAKERTFPIMFLSTNEFQWLVNTSLTPLNPGDCRGTTTSKMSKSLADAYAIADEEHDLGYFKGLLKAWQEEEEALRRQEAEAQAEAERVASEKAAEKSHPKEKAKKKAPRKSKGADDDMELDETEPPKSSKKRKKEAESDAETPKPKKTPKVTKLNAPKTPNGETPAAKTPTTKPKKKVAAPKPEPEDEAKPEMTEEQKLAQREKAILYLRHRLQKGFVSRDQAPQETEMAGMADFFTQLEAYEDLEGEIIRNTKIHKVLKAIVKLASVPKDDEFNFKKRSSALLEVWNKRMEQSQKPSESNSKPTAEQESALNGDEETAATIEAESKPNGDAAHDGNEKEDEKEDTAQGADNDETKAEANLEEAENPEKSVADDSAKTDAAARDEDAKKEAS